MEYEINDDLHMMPTVSVIIPVFRAEKYLARCIDSLFRQSYQKHEIILVDDGSDDRCPEMCDCYASLDARVTVIHQANQGLSAARNAGLEVARGEFIAFIDSDDWVHVDYLKSLVNNIGEAAVCCCGHQIVHDETEIADKGITSSDHITCCTCRQAIKRVDCQIYAWAKLYRRSFISDLRFDVNMKLSAEDRVFNAAFFTQHPDASCMVLPNKLYYYYKHEGTLSHETFFSDLPAIQRMISISEETKCDTLLDYLIRWLIQKRQSGFHIGNPPDFAGVEECLHQCDELCGSVIRNVLYRKKMRFMIRRPFLYLQLNRVKQLSIRVARLLNRNTQ